MAFNDSGHQAEEYLLMAAPQAGIPVLDRSAVGKDPRVPLALARATEQEDAGGMDFWVWSCGKWVRMDLTTAKNPEVLEEKERKARRNGVLVVSISFRVLKLASRGCCRDLERVKVAIRELGKF